MILFARRPDESGASGSNRPIPGREEWVSHAIYKDFTEPFDLIDRDILTIKMEHMALLRWCESYLKNRTNLVALRGFEYCALNVPYGVTQGSHIGPLFFLKYIDDLAEAIRCQ